ncbi:hypothetical protein I2F27_12060 [Acinetobacter sp. B5B]|uniref:GTPase domain-containing protein n=1 Tax=Acinetobacter baretiae TaxID=2605383 RepID=UPI0018C2E3A2|nr:GTPase domain-containing protein [Acinetobacter baretiae]MBF7684022.1 hypothetical protein [Acinetobacter baretiae]MBF7684032.1 hypothetical protein [Acinetobacter baretiae]
MVFITKILNKLVVSYQVLKKKIQGKKIVILGQRASGKTTLLNFLLKGEITVSYEQTIGVDRVEKTKNGTIKLENLGWDVKISSDQKDYAGTTSGYEQWKNACQEADIFIYLFNIETWIVNPDIIEDQILKDISNIEVILKEKDIPIYIIGTHLDKLLGISYKNESEKNIFIDELGNEPFIYGIKSRLVNDSKEAQVEILFGNLATDKDMEKLIKLMIDSFRG